MITDVKARYANGVLTPLESLALEVGAEVEGCRLSATIGLSLPLLLFSGLRAADN